MNPDNAYVDDPAVINTLIAEGANQGPVGWQALASVVANRSSQSGQTLRQVVSAPGQFEGYGKSKLDSSSPLYQRIAAVAGPILSGAQRPITDADSYYSPQAQAALGRAPPKFDDGSGVDLGGHRFFKAGYGGRSSTLRAGGASDSVAGDDGGDDAGSAADDLADFTGGPPSKSGARTAARGDDLAAGDLADMLGSDPSPAASAQPAGFKPGADKGVVNADTGVAANDAQAATLRRMQAAGQLNIDAKNPGSGPDNPMLSTGPGALPGAGKFYIGGDGVVRQVPDKGLAIAQADEARIQGTMAKTGTGPIGDFVDGAVSPFADELTGAIGAGTQGLYNFGSHLVGAPTNVSMADRFQAAEAAERMAQDRRDKVDPIASNLGRLVSPFLFGPEAGGASAVRAGAQLLGMGAGYGALDARGGPAERLKGAGEGAVMSALTAGVVGGGLGLARMAPRLARAVPGMGGVVDAIGDAAGGANRAMGSPFGRAPIPEGVTPPGVVPSDSQAAATYVQGLAAAAGKSPADIAASDAPTMAEAVGKSGVQHAAMLARRAGTSADTADQVFLSRRDARPARVLQTISDATGIDATFVSGDFQGQMANLRKAAAPLYQAAYDAPPPQSPTLDYLATRPSVKAGISKAYAIAKEEGRDPEALGLRDMEAPPAAADDFDLNTDTGPTFGQVLSGLRRGDAVNLSRGPTAIQTIGRGGGISDPGGDLTAMGADGAHLGKPFWNKLINPQARSADGWALPLQEQGYFPDMAPDQRPSIGDVHDLISDELAGAPTYGRQVDPQKLELSQRISDMGDYLRVHHDIHANDLPGYSDDQIAELMNPVTDGPHPYAPPPMEPVFSAEPSMQTWDYVKRGMNDVLEGYRDGTTGKLNLDDKGRAIKNTTQQLRNELVRQVPQYGEALAAGGEPLRQEQAWRDAPKLIADSTPEALFNKSWSDYTPAQRQAFQGGVVNHLYVQARRGLLTPRTLQSPAMQSKLQTVLGSDGMSKVTQMLAREKAMTAAERIVPPGAGSPTMGLQAAAKEADGVGGALIAGLGREALTSLAAHPTNPKLGAMHFVAKQYAKLLAPTGAPTMPMSVRNEAGRMLMQMSPAEFQAYVGQLFPASGPRLGLFGGSAPVVSGAAPAAAGAPVSPGLPAGLMGYLGGGPERRRLESGY